MTKYTDRNTFEIKIKHAAKCVTKSKNTATEFLKSAGIMDKNGHLAKEYK